MSQPLIAQLVDLLPSGKWLWLFLAFAALATLAGFGVGFFIARRL